MDNKINFIEKPPYSMNTLFFVGKHYPTYMVKDGKEYFIFGRPEPQSSLEKDEMNAHKQQLISNNGAYFNFFDNSGFHDPIALLKWVIQKRYTFEKDTKASMLSDGKTFDFKGNLRECSCAFFYRIFDKNIINEINQLLPNAKKEKGAIK